MSYYEAMDIRGFSFRSGRVVCIDCADRDDEPEYRDEIVTDDDSQDGYYFCDVCQERI